MAKTKSKATAKPKYKYELRQGKELDIYEKLPEGWKVDHGAMTAPVGTVMITNGGSLFGKNGLPRRQNALLISNKEWFEEDTLKSGEKIKRLTAPTKAKSAPKSTKKPKYRRAKPAKVYKNKDGKLVYKQSTDKVGDVLVNQAGVKYTITGERFHAPTGYDDGKLKVRVLQVKTSAGQTFEISDGEMEHYRQKNVLTREKKSKTTATKPPEKSKPVVQSKAVAQPKVAKTPAQKKTTYTVRGKTFATLAEAKAYKAAQKAKAGKPCEIKEGTRKPSHKIVSFTAKSK